MDVNLNGTKNLLTAAENLGVKRFIYTRYSSTVLLLLLTLSTMDVTFDGSHHRGETEADLVRRSLHLNETPVNPSLILLAPAD